MGSWYWLIFSNTYKTLITSGPDDPIISKVSRSQNLTVLSDEPAQVRIKAMDCKSTMSGFNSRNTKNQVKCMMQELIMTTTAILEKNWIKVHDCLYLNRRDKHEILSHVVHLNYSSLCTMTSCTTSRSCPPPARCAFFQSWRMIYMESVCLVAITEYYSFI